MSAETEARKYHADVYTGRDLEDLLETIADCNEARSQLESIKSFWLERPRDKVCILYGLRRSGKTTLLLQTAEYLRHMDAEKGTKEFEKTAYVLCRPGMTSSDVREDFKTLRATQFKTVLFDEATLSGDFIRNAAFLADSYARLNMRIILAGTDSLKFLKASRSSLYDRCELLHTTRIPYREWSRITGLHGPDAVDVYADYGGTFVLSGGAGRKAFEPKSLWNIKIREYLDEAVAENIGHTLDEIRPDSYLTGLKELRNAGELANIIHRAVQDDNHSFLLSVMDNSFTLRDFDNMKGRLAHTFELDGRDATEIGEVLLGIKNALKIKESWERAMTHDAGLCATTRAILIDLDLLALKSVQVYHESSREWAADNAGNILAMPAMRRCMAQLLVDGLTADTRFQHIELELREKAASAVMEQVHGRLLEDIATVEIADALRDARFAVLEGQETFQIRFAGPDEGPLKRDWGSAGCLPGERLTGEIDIAVSWRRPNPGCALFEVKRSRHIDLKAHAKHLSDPKKMQAIRTMFGPPRRKAILYGGPTSLDHCGTGIDYVSLAEFLESMPASLEAAMGPDTNALERVLAATKARQERLKLDEEARQRQRQAKVERRMLWTESQQTPSATMTGGTPVPIASPPDDERRRAEAVSLDAFGNRVLQGEELAELIRHAASFPPRDAAAPLERFLQNDPQGSFCFLYGLPGTGRRTMLMQALASSDPETLSRTAWIQCPHWAGGIELVRAADAAVQSGASCVVLDGAGDVPQLHLDAKLLGGMLWRRLHVVLSCALPLQAAIRASAGSSPERHPFEPVSVCSTCVPFRECGTSLEDCIRSGAPFGAAPDEFLTAAFESVRLSLEDRSRFPADRLPAFAVQNQARFLFLCTAELRQAACRLAMASLPESPFSGRRDSLCRRLALGLLEVLSDASDRKHASLLTSGAGWLASILCRCGLPTRKRAFAASPSGVLEKDWEDCTTAAMPGLLHGPAEDAVRAALARPGLAGLEGTEKAALERLAMDAVRSHILQDIVLSDCAMAAPSGWEVLQVRPAASRIPLTVLRRTDGPRSCMLIGAGNAENMASSPLFAKDACACIERACGTITGKAYLVHGNVPVNGKQNGVFVLSAEGFLRGLPDSLVEVKDAGER